MIAEKIASRPGRLDCGTTEGSLGLNFAAPSSFRICSRDGNLYLRIASRAPPMTRTEILTRYRRLRQISKKHHHDVLDIIAPDVLMDWAKRLDLTQGRTLVLESEHDMTSCHLPG